MAEQPEIAGQLKPAAATLTDLFTVPAGDNGVYHMMVSNTGGSPDEFRISLAKAGAADDLKQYIAFDVKSFKGSVDSLIIGIALSATDVVRVYSKNGNLTFNIFGITIT